MEAYNLEEIRKRNEEAMGENGDRDESDYHVRELLSVIEKITAERQIERQDLINYSASLIRERDAAISALKGMFELCDNYFDESGLVCDRDREIWKTGLEVLKNAGAK